MSSRGAQATGARSSTGEAIRPLIDRPAIDAEHGVIHDAIRDRDAGAAAAAVDRHIDTLERLDRRVGVL